MEKRTDIDLEILKGKLEDELALVSVELREVGRKNPDNKLDWEARPGDMEVDNADDSEVADRIEEYEGNTAVLKELETRYNDIKSALNKIEKGEYGYCEVCSFPIEEERLHANPSAKTCKNHMGS
jgi:RNA polymerase-binding transcription factor DksA